MGGGEDKSHRSHQEAVVLARPCCLCSLKLGQLLSLFDLSPDFSPPCGWASRFLGKLPGLLSRALSHTLLRPTSSLDSDGQVCTYVWGSCTKPGLKEEDLVCSVRERVESHELGLSNPSFQGFSEVTHRVGFKGDLVRAGQGVVWFWGTQSPQEPSPRMPCELGLHFWPQSPLDMSGSPPGPRWTGTGLRVPGAQCPGGRTGGSLYSMPFPPALCCSTSCLLLAALLSAPDVTLSHITAALHCPPPPHSSQSAMFHL